MQNFKTIISQLLKTPVDIHTAQTFFTFYGKTNKELPQKEKEVTVDYVIMGNLVKQAMDGNLKAVQMVNDIEFGKPVTQVDLQLPKDVEITPDLLEKLQTINKTGIEMLNQGWEVDKKGKKILHITFDGEDITDI